ncbi:MAG TPA: type VI secretion system baseplate subunit TssG [Caulobacteraceae bacterium]|jgi:type VI secretion system protein ImpH|nr:type VI secretion system baseplate subunit TssG [Caulobacteraceae bacterium]
MAAEDGAAPKHLSFISRIAAELDRYGLFPVLRGAEARAPNLPRIGMSRVPSQNIVDLAQAPVMHFPGPTLEGVKVVRGRPRIVGYWLGLTGPMGPLPLHLTEFASYERRYSQKRPFGDFLDVLAGRMLQLFYRAWADANPAAHADRPEDDHFARYIAALTGAADGVPENSAFPARARLHYAGVFASRRSAAGLQEALKNLLRTPIRLLEFQPRWRRIEDTDRSRLGRQFNGLGEDAVLGGRTYGVTDAFRVLVKAGTLRDYEDFLPTGQRFKVAAEALDALAPSHLEWDLALEIEARETQPTRLDGRSRLGWTGWLGAEAGGGARADAHLTRGARRLAVGRRARDVNVEGRLARVTEA